MNVQVEFTGWEGVQEVDSSEALHGLLREGRQMAGVLEVVILWASPIRVEIFATNGAHCWYGICVRVLPDSQCIDLEVLLAGVPEHKMMVVDVGHGPVQKEAMACFSDEQFSGLVFEALRTDSFPFSSDHFRFA